jgi:hypothetical protein
VTGQPAEANTAGFARSRDRFATILVWLEGDEAAGFDHAELECRLEVDGRELLRQLFQDHLDLRAHREARLDAVVDAEGVDRGTAEAGHERTLATVFGQVVVRRLAYRRRGRANLHPADAALNLPEEKHSHGLRRLAALEAARGSFDGAVETIGRVTGQQLGKRQAEDLAGRAAADFDDFYAARLRPAGDPGDALVLSCDGKGIVMRPDALRPATAKAAAQDTTKLATRLSKGEKRNRKRMAEVASVYDLTPIPRTPADILPATADQARDATPAPVAKGKWLMASVVADTASVLGRVFDEAERRDPTHRRGWVALVDGNNHQIQRIHTEAKAREINVRIVVDFVHVLEYLWKAAWSFFDEADPDAEAWVADKARAVLAGQATRVAAAIRRKATCHGLDAARRANADAAAKYLVNKAPYLDYATALKQGWPIATGVIEAPAAISLRIAWTSLAPAGASKAPKPSSDCVPCTATATSTTTGTTTSPKNDSEFTNSATPMVSSPRRHRPLQKSRTRVKPPTC